MIEVNIVLETIKKKKSTHDATAATSISPLGD
jgi:hypothetical protein